MTILLSLLFASQVLQFEVATIKRTPPRDPTADFSVSASLCRGIDNNDKMPNLPAGVPALGRCMVTNVSLRGIIAAAYPSAAFSIPLRQRVVGGPAWIDTEPFNMEGKADDPTTATEAQLKSMLQQLLADRFKLELHRETREVQGFALVVAKDGLRLKPGTGELSDGFHFSGGSMSSANATMDALARTLTPRVGAPVIDQTGLTGGYSITLPGNIGSNPSGVSASAALQDELGLRLEPRKINIDIIVIDKVERPTLDLSMANSIIHAAIGV